MEPTNKEILSCDDKEIVKAALEKKYPGAMDAIAKQLEVIGDDPSREGLINTPYRVVKSWLELYEYGADDDLGRIMSTSFEENIGDMDDMILCRDITFFSTCEHHMITFTGMAHIGYIPNNKVIGVSKMVRLVNHFARKLQIQERLGSKIANAMMQYLEPQGVGVIVTAKHMCMSARGVENQTSSMATSAMREKFRSQSQTRNEFLDLIKI
jgi:GTP cyclohydrolase I